jgi:putative oxidoreductase
MAERLELCSRGRAPLPVVAGLLFMQHGVQKLFGWLGGHQVETLGSQFGLAGVIESVGGLLIVLGLFTRPVALIAAGEMAVAYFQMHAPRGFWPIENHGELAALYGVIFLLFAGCGAGPLSLDALRTRERGDLTAAPPDILVR